MKYCLRALVVIVLFSSCGGDGGDGGESAQAPTIVAQPQSISAPDETNVTLSVTVTGTPPFGYQWQLAGVPIPDTNRPTYSTRAVYRASLHFDVAISNIVGSVTSETAIVSATPRPPLLTSQPASIAVTAGESAAFDVEVRGTNQFTIQWQRSNDAGATWFEIATQIGNVGRYGTVLRVAALADSGALFRAVVSNPGGTVTSQTATLTVS